MKRSSRTSCRSTPIASCTWRSASIVTMLPLRSTLEHCLIAVRSFWSGFAEQTLGCASIGLQRDA
eukprot:2891553-Prorocentrum_lima.AAC.1